MCRIHVIYSMLLGVPHGRGAQKRSKRGGPLVWEAFYIENKRFDLDTLRVPNRSPTPISKSNDFLGQSDDIWGACGPILGVPGVRAGLKTKKNI